MQGAQLVKTMVGGGEVPRPPYVPMLGSIVERLGQLPGPLYGTDPQRQARALAETAAALYADVVTVGMRAPGDSALEVLTRVRPFLAGRAVAGVVDRADVTLARAFCEQEVDLLIVAPGEPPETSRLRSLGNACRFYRVPVIYFPPDGTDPGPVVDEAGLDGAIVTHVTGSEPGIVGGGLDERRVADDTPVEPPRRHRFFWSFAGEVPAHLTPEALGGLGRRLHGA